MTERVLVCRCEDVTRHEVEEAVSAGHRDLESLKRYTGFGTGVCQGKQCTALAARMLVELGGEPPLVPITPRPPFHPVSVAHLAGTLEDSETGATRSTSAERAAPGEPGRRSAR